MSDCVKFLIRNQSNSLKPGQTFMTNDPFEAVHIYQILLLLAQYSFLIRTKAQYFCLLQRASRRYRWNNSRFNAGKKLKDSTGGSIIQAYGGCGG